MQTSKDQRLLVIYRPKVLDFNTYMINPFQYSVGNYNFLYFLVLAFLIDRQHALVSNHLTTRAGLKVKS